MVSLEMIKELYYLRGVLGRHELFSTTAGLSFENPTQSISGNSQLTVAELHKCRKAMRFPWCNGLFTDALQPDVLSAIEVVHSVNRSKEELDILTMEHRLLCW